MTVSPGAQAGGEASLSLNRHEDPDSDLEDLVDPVMIRQADEVLLENDFLSDSVEVP